MDRETFLNRAKELVENVDDLPTIPAVANQVLQMVDTPDVQIEEVADLMLTDQVMTARVMKMINSPVYKPEHQITSLKRALVFLGLKHIREIALTTSFIGAFKVEGAIEISSFWEHSFGVGMVAKIIAKKVGYKDLENAYIAGIIHDIGEVFLSQFETKKFQEILDSIKEKPVKLVDAERDALGTTHAELGFCIAEKWNFPPLYKEVIALHHTPAEAEIDPILCAIVNLADLFCGVRGLNYGDREWVSFNLNEEDGWKILQKHSPPLAEMDVERFCYEIDDAIPDVKELVNSIFKTEP